MRTSPGYTLPSLGGDAAANLDCRCRWSNRRFGDGPFEFPVGERSQNLRSAQSTRREKDRRWRAGLFRWLRASSYERRAWTARIGVCASSRPNGSLPGLVDPSFDLLSSSRCPLLAPVLPCPRSFKLEARSSVLAAETLPDIPEGDAGGAVGDDGAQGGEFRVVE